MRRIVFPGLVSTLPLFGTATAMPAAAVTPAPVAVETPSILVVGEAVAAPVGARHEATASDGTQMLAIGNSVLAIGADAIPPAQEAVASIGGEADAQEPDWMAPDAPLSLRGGAGR